MMNLAMWTSRMAQIFRVPECVAGKRGWYVKQEVRLWVSANV